MKCSLKTETVFELNLQRTTRYTSETFHKVSIQSVRDQIFFLNVKENNYFNKFDSVLSLLSWVLKKKKAALICFLKYQIFKNQADKIISLIKHQIKCDPVKTGYTARIDFCIWTKNTEFVSKCSWAERRNSVSYWRKKKCWSLDVLLIT